MLSATDTGAGPSDCMLCISLAAGGIIATA
jgi:hypothetical protein